MQAKNITKKFRKKVVLDGINLTIGKGVYGMLGPNGAGKTTLIRCLLGIYTPNSGEIDRGGVEKHQIGYLPQKFGLFKELTVNDMLSYFCSLKSIAKPERADAIDKVLHMVHMEEHKNERISKLSGGMCRRTGIAQAILGSPSMVFFDEPTVGLDPEERKRFKAVIREMSSVSTIVLSTHIVEDLEAVCDRVIVMNQGKIAADGSLEEIRTVAGDDASLEDAYLSITQKR